MLLESGISLSETLGLVINLEKSKKRLMALGVMKKHVEQGLTLSKSIALAKLKFDPTLLSMISFGETSGILAGSLRQALLILERGNQIQKKLIGALMYPAFIALATVGMTLFLVMYIFPKIIPLFTSMNIKLPLLTQAVQFIYFALLKYGIWMILGLMVAGIIFIYFYLKKKRFRSKVQSLLLTLPITGQLLQKYFISSDCRSIGTLLECGQTLPIILGQIAGASTSEIYKKCWKHVEAETMRGISVSVALRSFKSFYPSIVPDMLSIGERTGSLSSMFLHVSRMYEEEIEDVIKQLSTVIEPVLMIAMGLIVGSVALSIILPIYEVTNHLQH